MSDFCKVFDCDGNFFTCSASEEPRIDAAVSAYIDSGGTRDTLLALDLPEGGVMKCRASHIVSWFVSTPEARKRYLAWQRELDDAERTAKQELGIWDE